MLWSFLALCLFFGPIKVALHNSMVEIIYLILDLGAAAQFLHCQKQADLAPPHLKLSSFIEVLFVISI